MCGAGRTRTVQKGLRIRSGRRNTETKYGDCHRFLWFLSPPVFIPPVFIPVTGFYPRFLSRFLSVRRNASLRYECPLVQMDVAHFDVATQMRQRLLDDDGDVAPIGWWPGCVGRRPARFHRVDVQTGGKGRIRHKLGEGVSVRVAKLRINQARRPAECRPAVHVPLRLNDIRVVLQTIQRVGRHAGEGNSLRPGVSEQREVKDACSVTGWSRS
jgi:hypothetical protein